MHTGTHLVDIFLSEVFCPDSRDFKSLKEGGVQEISIDGQFNLFLSKCLKALCLNAF